MEKSNHQLTEQERADLAGLVRLTINGGFAARQVLAQFCMACLLRETDALLDAHHTAMRSPGVTEAQAALISESCRQYAEAANSLESLCLRISAAMELVTGVNREEAAQTWKEMKEEIQC